MIEIEPQIDRIGGVFKRRAKSQAFVYLRNNKQLAFWIGVLVTIWTSAILAPFVATHDPLEQTDDFLHPPSAKYWLGTDELGRDLFSRIVYGGRVSLSVGIVAVSIAVFIGSTLGLIAGYVGRFVDSIIMRFIDGLMAFPSILLAILIMAVLGSSLTNLMIAVGISAVPWYARMVRGSTLSIKFTQYVESARAVGASDARIIVRPSGTSSLVNKRKNSATRSTTSGPAATRCPSNASKISSRVGGVGSPPSQKLTAALNLSGAMITPICLNLSV